MASPILYDRPMKNRLGLYGRFVKVEHTLFSIPLLLSGAVLAGGALPGWRLIGLILLAGFGGRTAAFAINRIADRHFDKLNPRTAKRELPQGLMSLSEAVAVGLFGVLVYIIAAWAIAPICLYLSPVPLAIFAIYPYLKRFTPLAHFGVGLADALAPLGGWVAVTQSLESPVPGILLGLFTFFWVSGFDIIYSTMDEEFDRSQGLHSLPSRFGRQGAMKISGVLHLAAFLSLALLYDLSLRGVPALVTLLAIGGFLLLEQLMSDDVELAFFKINAVLGFGVLGLVALGVRG